MQTLNYHDNIVWKILELKNNILVSASNDSSIIFYIKDNKDYKKDYKISTNGSCSSIIQTKDNEICYSKSDNNTICFYNILERKNIASISKLNKYNGKREWYIMIRKDLLLIPGNKEISIINISDYKILNIIQVPDSNIFTGVC